ncbi:MAG TPA: hypothetical protein VNC79_11545, partial [Mycobacteriales bacterium]|nr:hypothetical protein [Mycobacteriales bacterium]
MTDEDLRGPTDWGTTVGVGPWTGPWPEDPRLDPQLLAGGDDLLQGRAQSLPPALPLKSPVKRRAEAFGED